VRDVWFEEELAPLEETVDRIVKAGVDSVEDPAEVRDAARGTVRVQQPRWGPWENPEQPVLASGRRSRFVLVRLGFEFELAEPARYLKSRFVCARCSGELDPAVTGEPAPSVYEMIPRALYEGEPRRVSVAIEPSLALGPLQASVGHVSLEHTLGAVEPAITGWKGDDERLPRWELRPKSESLVGERNLWLALELSAGCSAARLTVSAEGDVRTKRFGIIPAGTETARRERPSVAIGAEEPRA
jgi:hypothetical protein